jgi:LacI family transcriptional regulator
MTMATLSDVAKVAGVGVMSVSRVVNGTRKVSPETERKVRAAIKRIGYQPNEAARILKGYRARIIGLIVPDLAHPFFATCANAIQQTAWEAGYLTLMSATGHQEELERHETEIMVQRRVSGLLVIPTGLQNNHFAEAAASHIPIVSLDRPLNHVEADSLVVDNFAATVLATEHLIGHGHRHILCIADDEKTFTKTQRVAGYSEAMRKAGLTPRVCLIGPLSGMLSDQLNFALNSPAAPTALFATSNVIALNTLRELKERSVRIPEEMALISFDDFDLATLIQPMITVIQQPVFELARSAATLLFNRMSDRTVGAKTQVVLPTKLIIRESCGCGR